MITESELLKAKSDGKQSTNTSKFLKYTNLTTRDAPVKKIMNLKLKKNKLPNKTTMKKCAVKKVCRRNFPSQRRRREVVRLVVEALGFRLTRLGRSIFGDINGFCRIVARPDTSLIWSCQHMKLVDNELPEEDTEYSVNHIDSDSDESDVE